MPIKKPIAFLVGTLLLGPALAQNGSAPVPDKVREALGKTPAPAAAATDDRSKLKNYDTTLYERLSTDKQSLYDQLGGKAVIERFVGDGVDLLIADRRIAHFFEEVDPDTLKAQLTAQICELARGPCKYKSRSMELAHEGLNLTDADFNALVEDFQIAMRRNGVSFELENKVLALLAPMKPAIVYR